jgi:ADP-ribosylglycohydrolase
MLDDETSLPTPIPNSYWVVPGRLLAGEYPGSTSRADAMQRLERLLAAGVTSFLDLTEEEELPAYQGLLGKLTEQPIRHRRWSISDHSIPESDKRMADILDYLDSELRAGRCVYVHCRAGIGRTGTTIACHLVRTGLTNEAALERLQDLWRLCARSKNWPRVPETEDQIQFVRTWRDRANLPGADVDLRARYEGALVGLAIADALATAVATSGFDPATLTARARETSAWTSGADTAMTRCVVESLIARGAHDPADQLQRYLDWTRSTVIAIPPELKRALAVWQWSKKVQAGSHDPKNLDPHSLARTLGPVLHSSTDPAAAIELALEVSRTTQQSPVVLDLCRVWAAMFIDALHGTPKTQLDTRSGATMRLVSRRVLKPPVRALLAGKSRSEGEMADDAISVTEHAHAQFAAADNFKDAVLRCLTQRKALASAAALCGALAGAHYGIDAIPAEWRSRLPDEPALRSLARHCLH